MSEGFADRPPRSFWIISAIALLWNLLGIMAFVMQVNMSAASKAALSEAERALYESTPGWVIVVFAVAVFAGTLGSLFLLLRKARALPLLVLSLAAIVVQVFHNLFLSNTVEVLGPQAAALPIVLIVAAVFLAWYARLAKSRGWLA